MKRTFYLKLIFTGLLILNLLNWLAPVLSNSNQLFLQWIGTGIYFLLDPACHQQPERSFFIDGLPMALCVRCTFIYLGMALGVAVLYFKRKLTVARFVYVSFLLFFILEMGSEWIGLYSNWKLLRSFSGFISGILLIFFLLNDFNWFQQEER